MLRLEHGLSIRQVNTVIKTIVALGITHSERQIQELPPDVQAKVVMHEQHKCDCKTDRGCKKKRQRIWNAALNALPRKIVPLFDREEVRAYSSYANGHTALSAEVAEDIELRAIRAALSYRLCADIVRPLQNRPKGTTESLPMQIARDIASVDKIPAQANGEGKLTVPAIEDYDKGPRGKLKRRFGHVISAGHGKPLKTFDRPIWEHGSRTSARTIADTHLANNWMKGALEQAEKRVKATRSPAFRQAEEVFDRIFDVKQVVENKEAA